MFSARDPSDVDRFFRGLTEYAFHARLGLVDPPLVDYVSLLLVRFLRNDAATLGSGTSPATTDVAALLVEAAATPEPDEAREEYRHIGDITLFWSGLYPEALQRPDAPARIDRLTAYRTTGKHAYRLAATLEPADAAAEKRLLEQLAEEYDLCVEGLAEVRRIWSEG
ncbi:MAG: hypothetical protein ACKO40_01195 [Planctomycetaceae bacterium]